MMNQLVLIGRVLETRKEDKGAVLTIATQQSFKNMDGEYDTNFFDIRLFGGVADNTLDYVKKGDLVGIKGRLQRIDTQKSVEIIAERLTFLSSTKKDEE